MELETIIINKKFYPLPKDLETLKELEKLMTHINQPINSKLSSLLQVLCATTTNPKMVEYLLKQGANPYYMDINGKTAYDYAIRNPNQWARILNYIALK